MPGDDLQRERAGLMGLFSSLFPPSTTAAEAHEAVGRREALIIDVRERHEWKAGHAPGAKNIPLSQLRSRAHELAPDRRYVAVCRSGSRSRSATAQLRGAGLDAVNLRGGMHGWARAGLPLEPRRGRIV
jgi:rhodanese-related sulfurtransferase